MPLVERGCLARSRLPLVWLRVLECPDGLVTERADAGPAQALVREHGYEPAGCAGPGVVQPGSAQHQRRRSVPWFCS